MNAKSSEYKIFYRLFVNGLEPLIADVFIQRFYFSVIYYTILKVKTAGDPLQLTTPSSKKIFVATNDELATNIRFPF